MKNILMMEMLKCPRPKTEYIPVGINTVVHESNPWSNNSPSGPEVPVLLACFPSIPSAQKETIHAICDYQHWTVKYKFQSDNDGE